MNPTIEESPGVVAARGRRDDITKKSRSIESRMEHLHALIGAQETEQERLRTEQIFADREPDKPYAVLLEQLDHHRAELRDLIIELKAHQAAEQRAQTAIAEAQRHAVESAANRLMERISLLVPALWEALQAAKSINDQLETLEGELRRLPPMQLPEKQAVLVQRAGVSFPALSEHAKGQLFGIAQWEECLKNLGLLAHP